MIADGELNPGQRLVEADLIEQLSVSRGTLREAMRALASEGLIDLTLYQSARVRRFEKVELRDQFEIRLELESLASRWAAMRQPDAGIALQALLKQMEVAASLKDVRAHIDLNREFHNIILEAAGNKQLKEILRLLHIQAFRAISTKILTHDDALQSNRDHDILATAIAAGDGDAAYAAMRAHIVRSQRLIDRL